MGAEYSRVEARSPGSWPTLQCSAHYSNSDVAVWPHLSPLAQWFTAQDALALRAKLDQRTSSSLLTYAEFVAWLQNGRPPVVLHQPTMPVRHDILTPPEFVSDRALAKLAGAAGGDPTATRMLEMYLEHVFHSFRSPNCSKVYAMEVLAALVLVSHAIWSVDEKVDVLMALFCDPALSARHSHHCSSPFSSSETWWFKETDVAQLLLCAMRGVAKVTVGVSTVWERHGVTVSAVARTLSAASVRDAEAARASDGSDHPSPSKLANAMPSRTLYSGAPHQQRHQFSTTSVAHLSTSISAREFRQFVARRPEIQRFVALFASEELRNPFTFAPLRSLSTGVPMPGHYRSVLATQTHTYHSLLQRYVSFDGRDARRRQSAAVLIQCAWRRRQSRALLAQHQQLRARQRHICAATVQGYVRQFRFAKILEQHANAEREAFNGGLFVAGSGPCIPSNVLTGDRNASATQNHPGLSVATSPLTLVGAFKLGNVRISSVAASQNFAVAVASDREWLFAWGRCLPCVYEGDPSVRLFQPTPTRLVHTFASNSVVQVACGLQHALVLTDDGMVHSWGFNDHGQLGHGAAETLEARTSGRTTYATYFDERDGRASEFLAAPTRLVYFLGSPMQHADPIPVQQICCGDYSCMALSCDGDVFTWGEASEGQLGHGDAHTAFQVAFADEHMLNSAFTFLSQPEPVLALSDVEVVQISCCKNHSAALASDGRVFEWGSWGKRRGRDMENAFVPVETEGTRELQLRQLSVGDHHMLAEGSSAWMRVVPPTSAVGGSSDGQMDDDRSVSADATTPKTDDSPDGATERLRSQPAARGEDKNAFYLACDTSSCSFEAIERSFASSGAPTRRTWECVIIDFDVDDLDDDPDELFEPIDEGISSDRAPPLARSESTGDVRSVWRKRVEPFALSVDQVGRFDARARQLRPLASRLHPSSSYKQLLNTWLGGHVERRFVAFPSGPPAGFYVQFLVPPASSVARVDRDQRDESEQTDSVPAPRVVEFRVCSSSTAERMVGKRGFAVHAFHPHVADAKKRTKRQRQKRQHLSLVTGANSLFVLEFDASCLPSTSETEAFNDDATVLSSVVVDELTARVLAAQEAGVLAVLVVLDLWNAAPFELAFQDDAGVYIPVFMVHKFALATPSHPSDSGVDRDRTSLYEVLERMLAPLDDGLEADSVAGSVLGGTAAPPPMMRRAASTHRFVTRPLWTVRCFRRVDTLRTRVQSALANGAAGVVVIQDVASVERDYETRDDDAPVGLSLRSLVSDITCGGNAQERLDDRLVATISHDDGVRLRAASHVTTCDTYLPSRDGAAYELLAHVAVEVRPGGSTYAWGNAQHGRLGVGSRSRTWTRTSGGFQDGYDALTDTTYCFLDRPTPVGTLAGVELRQLECGAAHSLAVTSRDGRVYAWGCGSHGALVRTRVDPSAATQRPGERGDEGAATRDVWVPTLVHGLRLETIVQATATDASSLFVTETVVSPALYRERRREIAQLQAVVKKRRVVGE